MTLDEALKILRHEHTIIENFDEYTETETMQALDMAIKALEQEPKWIFVKWHEITEEEREREGYPKEWVTYFDSEMPADGEEILITVKYTHPITSEVVYSVMKDECFYDDGFGLDSGYDWIDDVVAWMHLPEPYKAGEEE